MIIQLSVNADKMIKVHDHFTEQRGPMNQPKKFMEEAVELFEAIVLGDVAHSEEEAADVLITLTQLILKRMDPEKVQQHLDEKTERIERRIEIGYYTKKDA